MTKRMLNN